MFRIVIDDDVSLAGRNIVLAEKQILAKQKAPIIYDPKAILRKSRARYHHW